MNISERAGEFAGRIRDVLRDPNTEAIREITGHLQAATETRDPATEQEHLGAISQIIDERFPFVQVDTQPENSRP